MWYHVILQHFLGRMALTKLANGLLFNLLGKTSLAIRHNLAEWKLFTRLRPYINKAGIDVVRVLILGCHLQLHTVEVI